MAEAIRVAYQGVIAVDDVRIDVQRGELCGLIGPNGSGKSSLLGVLSRLVSPARGRIEIDGRDYTRCLPSDVVRLGIARTFQTVRFAPSLTLVENVMLGCDARAPGMGIFESVLAIRRGRRWEQQAFERAREWVSFVGLGDVADRFPGTLSYGLQRKAELARALASEPKLLLLDEPTAGMSEKERDEIGDLLLNVTAGGTAVLIVEHNLRLINRVCEWLFVLAEGRCIAAGEPTEVSSSPAVVEAYLGKAAQSVER